MERQEKITVLIASVKEREKSLRIVLDRIYDQVDSIELVLNFYIDVPKWLDDKPKIVAHLNPTNKHAHDSIWSHVPEDGFVAVCDDDLLYPPDFFYKLISGLRRHDNKVIVSCHGSNLILPASDYTECKQTWGFSDRMERDVYNDLCGVGCCAFHTSTLQPELNSFPLAFMRDIYLSLLCKKNDVPIVNIQRPSNWVNPLQTPGGTVYEETLNNKQLRSLKNRVMKEQLLPALHCNQKNEDNKYVLVTDYGFDPRLVSKTLETLDDVSDCNIVMFTDEPKDYDFSSERYAPKKKVLVQYVTPDERAIGRMGSKVLTQYRFILGLPNGSRVVSADGDLYFVRDVFQAFDEELVGGDIGVTTRCEPYKYPINGGVVFFRVNDQVKDLLRFLIGQIYERTWPELIAYEKEFGHDKQENPNSWYFDQNLWCCAHIYREQIAKQFGVDIAGLSAYWNYAPHSDGTMEQIAAGKAKLMAAYHNEDVACVLHLKSRLKELLFQGLLP